MYKVFCDGYTLHDPSLNDVHFQLISPVVTQEVNKAGSFTFTIPAAHANANALQRLLSTIEVYDDSKLIFRGRILNDTRDWDDSRQVVCESDIAVLNDTTQRPYTFTGTVAAYISKLIGTHNTMAPADKQFTVGTVNVSGSVSIEQTGYSSTWHELEEKVLNQFSGYLFVTWTGSANRIDFLVDSPYHCEQKISFGENLLDITRESKGENVITALIPLGAKAESTGEPLTIKSVNGGIDYITNASAVEAYGLIFGTETWDTVTNAAELLARGQARLAELSQGVTTITLTAADLHLLDNEISSFDFLSYVTVEDLVHGVNGTMLVTKKTTNLTDPAQGKLTIGRESSGISKYYAETSDQIQTIRQTYATQEQVDTVNTTLQSEIHTQADKIAMVVSESAGSYVIKSAEIVAAINESGSTVKISADHIALTGALIVSMINEGSTTINGNKITTGTLNASAIGAGTIDASVINVTNLDASNISTGHLIVKNSSNNTLLDADVDNGTVIIGGFTVTADKFTNTDGTTSVDITSGGTVYITKGNSGTYLMADAIGIATGGNRIIEIQNDSSYGTQLWAHSQNGDSYVRPGILVAEDATGENTTTVYPTGIMFDDDMGHASVMRALGYSLDVAATTQVELQRGVYLALATRANVTDANQSGLYLIQAGATNSSVKSISAASGVTLSVSGLTLTWTTTNTARALRLIRLS